MGRRWTNRPIEPLNRITSEKLSNEPASESDYLGVIRSSFDATIDRYCGYGEAIGGWARARNQFEQIRDQLGPGRKSGPRPMQGGDWGGLTVLRELQKDVIS